MNSPSNANAAWRYLFRRWRYRKGLTRVWVTTGGKDAWDLVTRWSLIRAAFSRKDVWL
jgi:hypothetical protein